MSPTILAGDHILAGPGPGPLYNQPEYGDVVVFIPPGYPGASFIKRVIGLPGDTVQITGGLLFINGVQVPLTDDGAYTDTSEGEPVAAERFTETLPSGHVHDIEKMTSAGFANNTPVYTVPAGDLFVLGDNRDNSVDSRFMDGPVGFVPIANVFYQVKSIYFSVDFQHPAWEFWDWPREIRWSRIGQHIS